MRFFKPNIDRLSMKRDVPGLVEALGDSDRTLRSDAGQVLAKLGAPGIEALLAALRHKSAVVRESAALALGSGSIRATEALSEVLRNDRSPVVRAAAATAIGQTRDATCAEALVAALADSPEVNASAREALIDVGGAAVDALVAGLKSPERKIRESAAWLLGEIAEPRSFRPLVAALQDGDPTVVQQASHAVERFSRVQKGLIADLQNPTLAVRRSVAKALDELGWEPDSGATGAAYWATKCRWDECLRIGPPAVGALIRAILGTAKPGEDRTEEQAAAAETLGAIGAPAILPLIAASELAHYPDDANALLLSLAYVRDPNAVEPLIGMLHANKYGQHYAALALARIGDPRAVAPLGVAAADATWHNDVRRACAGALGSLGDRGGVEPLISILTRRSERVDLEVAAIEALGMIGDRRACEAVVDTMFRFPLNDYAWYSVATAVRALFEDLTEPILEISGYTVTDTHGQKTTQEIREEACWTGSGKLQFQLQRNRVALRGLCSHATPVTTNLLYQVRDCLAKKTSYPGAAAEFQRDFGKLREDAASELARRGNPPFDPAAYLTAEGWRLEKEEA